MHHVIAKGKGRSTKQSVAILWDSVTEPERLASTMKLEENRKAVADYAAGKHSGSDPGKWLGASSPAELDDRLIKGWPEGVSKLEQLATREIHPVSLRRRRVRGDQGDEVDMQAVYRGDLSRAWIKTRRQSRPGTNRSITIICNLGDSFSVTADKLFWRGAAVLKLTDALTSSGYSVSLYGAVTSAECSADQKVSAAQFVEIKAADSPLDLSQLAALTAMPGWFRTRGFAGITAACDLVGQRPEYGLGHPDHAAIPAFAEMLGITGAIVQPKVNDKESAEAWIDAVMAQLEPEAH